jgi:hypothetical protein
MTLEELFEKHKCTDEEQRALVRYYMVLRLEYLFKVVMIWLR